MEIPAKIARAVLICHDSEPLNRFGLARWMASFLELSAIIEIHEPPGRLKKRISRELKRIGAWRFLDVLAFRLYSRLMLAKKDRRFDERIMRELESSYPDIPPGTPILRTPTPNSATNALWCFRQSDALGYRRHGFCQKPGIFAIAARVRLLKVLHCCSISAPVRMVFKR